MLLCYKLLDEKVEDATRWGVVDGGICDVPLPVGPPALCRPIMAYIPLRHFHFSRLTPTQQDHGFAALRTRSLTGPDQYSIIRQLTDGIATGTAGHFSLYSPTRHRLTTRNEFSSWK
ncbi:UPF0242 protein [Dirofilaria immitis]